MEAGDGFTGIAEEGGCTQVTSMKLVPWRNYWEQSRWLFKASTRLNGVLNAVNIGDVEIQNVFQYIARALHKTNIS